MAPPQTPYTPKLHGEHEGARAREFYKYYEPYDNLMKHSDENVTTGADGRTASFDNALAAFAQFICLRLRVRRCLISCFDRNYQYVLAEATTSLSLVTHKATDDQDQLWLGAGTQDRHTMLCERTLELAEEKQHGGDNGLVVFPDIFHDEWYKGCQSQLKTPPNMRFYAGTAIRSPFGPVIGVISVMDDDPRVSLSDQDGSFLQHMSGVIMSHLDNFRSKEEHHRTSQMVIGLGSYVEGKDHLDTGLHSHTISAARDIEHADAHSETPGVPVTRPPEAALSQTHDAQGHGGQTHSQPSSENLQSSMLSTDVKSTFHRAACIIKDAIDVAGVVFFDASVGSFGGLVQSVPTNEDATTSYFARLTTSSKECHVLARSGQPESGEPMTEGFLHSLLSRYAPGRIFNIDLQESGPSMTNPLTPEEPEDYNERLDPPEEQHDDAETREVVRRQRQTDLEQLKRLFPKARSLAFVPMWDDHRMRWFAGGIVWSDKEIRLLHKDSELSFLRAFGISIMSEVAKLDTAMADKAKSDLLNSISHELRSPLHGILGSIECLESSTLDSVQRGLVETVDVCGRTLLDTIDHLLDFSKINNFTRNRNKRQQEPNNKQASMLSLKAQIHLPTITEEALETVFAGHSSVKLTRANSGLSQPRVGDEKGSNANVQVIVDVEAKGYEDWLFNTESGSWRRLVMNLTGNSLKYTSEGYIHVSLKVKELPKTRDGVIRNRITLIVKDTGRGISKEYLDNHLFRPFAQEDPLQSGAGLGLSMVQQIVNNLGGEIFVESELNKGTEVRIEMIMLKASKSTSDNEAVSAMNEATKQLEGLKTVFVDPPITPTGESPAQRLLRKALDRQCWGWFKMNFDTVSEVQEVNDAEIMITTCRNLSGIKGLLIDVGKPTVVLCDDSSQLQQGYMESETLRKAVATNFIVQPFGPRKLANALVACKQQFAQALEDIIIQRDTDLAAMPNLSRRDDQTRPSTPVSRSVDTGTAEETTQNKGQTAKDQAAGAEQEGPKRLRLLLVDDNKINISLLVRYCKSKKHDYVTAEDGAEAVETFSQNQQDEATRFNFICMDISMPRMDGLEATRRIRSFEQANNLSASYIIALTGLASAEAQQEAFSSGVDQFMTKPVRLKELGEVLSGSRR